MGKRGTGKKKKKNLPLVCLITLKKKKDIQVTKIFQDM